MKRALLLLLVCLGASWAAPVDQEGPEAASCVDPVVLGAAAQAMDKINKDRTEGYVFSLRDLANAHMQQHGENGIVFYLTMNVLETNCSVLSKAHFKNCEVRSLGSTPVYGQCKVAIFISRVNRVVRLYKYSCLVRPVAARKVNDFCPDCPTYSDKNNAEIKKTVSKSLEKFNKESGLSKHFALLQVTRASSGWGMGMIYNVQYTIQETTCANGVEKPDDCPPMDCEFAHKGFCKGSHVHGPSPTKEEFVDVTCEIYEPEVAEREKKLHLLGGETDHSHNDTDVTNPAQGHDHAHDHTKGHQHHDDTHKHGADDQHHHVHDHTQGAHRHAHDHSHDHGHGHDHVHAHHEKAHNHSGDHPNQHHQYQHAAGTNTHHHDHEMALDHDHKHLHLHEHEHHHHHHGHEHHDTTPHHHPEGMWRQIAPLSEAVTLPAFPDVPAAAGPPEMGVTLPLKTDPEIPGQNEPVIGPFPVKVSAECPLPAIVADNDIVGKLFLEDPEFKVTA